MSTVLNEFHQCTGVRLPEWTARKSPERVTLIGRLCKLEPLDAAKHSLDLYTAYVVATDERDWTYMTMGPFRNAEEYRSYVETAAGGSDPMHFAVIDLVTQRAVGTLALMRIDVQNGVIEVGSVMFSPLLKRTPLSTEAQYLLMRYVFEDLEYRRYEWKCDSYNEPSRRAATRLGFQFEGAFRQAVVYKGRSRDTAWFSIIDGEWPARRSAFERWLDPGNFDQEGKQVKSLSDFSEAEI
ncbi:GNAT family N-acetyltransferase [Cupriavidus basilensis]|nr:GNAT family protein [Cupriavidus basilensis]NUA31302.1 GNAT family N-acetyltransferase [Cupriavidus basilensis]